MHHGYGLLEGTHEGRARVTPIDVALEPLDEPRRRGVSVIDQIRCLPTKLIAGRPFTGARTPKTEIPHSR